MTLSLNLSAFKAQLYLFLDTARKSAQSTKKVLPLSTVVPSVPGSPSWAECVSCQGSAPGQINHSFLFNLSHKCDVQELELALAGNLCLWETAVCLCVWTLVLDSSILLSLMQWAPSPIGLWLQCWLRAPVILSAVCPPCGHVQCYYVCLNERITFFCLLTPEVTDSMFDLYLLLIHVPGCLAGVKAGFWKNDKTQMCSAYERNMIKCTF